ncbi:copper amine oxidase [Paenibacillaceae bacterium]|nr:copper amine oxidase [Paenibacillaceae bacterium]
MKEVDFLSRNIRKITLGAAAVLLSASLLNGAPVAAAESKTPVIQKEAVQTEAASPFRIVAIGDSLTAGYEFEFTEQSIPYGYVERIYEQALFHGRAQYVNYGLLGLKSEGLKNWLEAAQIGTSPAAADIAGADKDPRAAALLAQTGALRSNLEQADLVVLTIGGNDFSDIITIARNPDADLEEWSSNKFTSYTAALEASLRTIHSIAPNARIVVSDVYSPVPNLAIVGVSQVQYDQIQKYVGQATKQIDGVIAKLTSEGVKAEVAHSAEKFSLREQSLTWILKKDIHPNQDGYAVIGKAFADTIWNEYRTPLPRAEDVGISVIVNGKEVVTPFKPVLKANRTYLAFRDIADAMGAETKWDNKAKAVTITLGSNTVELAVGATTMLVNGKSVNIDTPAFLHHVGKEQKIYVPLAVLADGLDYQVEYRSTLKTAFINR